MEMTERERLEQAIATLKAQRIHLERTEAIFAEIGAAWDLARARELLELGGER